MKISITGVAGFIGSNLAKSFLNNGHTVIGINNLTRTNFSMYHPVRNHPDYTFIKGDISNVETPITAAKNCDMIYHLATLKISRLGNAYDTLQINAAGTQNAIEAAGHSNAHLIFSSTSDVYGKNPNIPFSEEHDLIIGPPTAKRWDYALIKAFDERMCFAEAERRDLKFTVIRFFGGYGPNQHLTSWGGPQSVFISNALDNIPIPVHSEGLQTRSFNTVKLLNNSGRINIRVISHSVNQGLGAAFQTAFSHFLACHLDPSDLVITLEGDATSDPSFLTRMLKRTSEGDDIILASPYLYSGYFSGVQIHRIIISHIAIFLFKLFLNIHGLATISCFFRIYRGNALLCLNAHYPNAIVINKGYDHAAEIIVKAVRNQLNTLELLLRWIGPEAKVDL